MTFDPRTAYLSDDEAARLYVRHPGLGRSYVDYCPTCNKAGTYIWRGVEQACDCELQLQLAKIYFAAGIGLTYQRLDWGDFQGADEVVAGVAKYIENHQSYISRGVGLFFTGPFGIGKSMLATLALKEFVKLGYRCYATTFAQTIEAFTSTWGRDGKANQEFFQDKFLYSEVLLLDDLGRELSGTTKLSESTFDTILRQRVSAGRPTFLTTNLTMSQLERGYGGAVLSLLREKSVVFEFTGEDFRPKANRRELDEIALGEVRPII